ncbi:hypothetical protein [Hyphococcus sp.]|uniref:hypothetical protein n=1 Tax=Hyphococcus sp. TaxID=2038636 RepID=UPI003CCBA668
MEAGNYQSYLLLAAFVVAFFFVLSLAATSLFIWFGWQPPKLLSGLFNAPKLLMIIGWAGIVYMIASALLDFPFIDLFPAQGESGISS